jgi:hypothetical protein
MWDTCTRGNLQTTDSRTRPKEMSSKNLNHVTYKSNIGKIK